MKYQFIESEITYDGTQLSPHWIYRHFDLPGNAMVAFIGGCDVSLDHMVDLADVKNQDPIYSPRMLHFIGEFFEGDLERMILWQRLLMVIIREELEERGIPGRIIRRGDDLYHSGVAGVVRKLSVSIATSSVTSNLIHIGINIQTGGVPVPAVGLGELSIEPEGFACSVLKRFHREYEQVGIARCKVRGV